MDTMHMYVRHTHKIAILPFPWLVYTPCTHTHSQPQFNWNCDKSPTMIALGSRSLPLPPAPSRSYSLYTTRRCTPEHLLELSLVSIIFKWIFAMKSISFDAIPLRNHISLQWNDFLDSNKISFEFSFVRSISIILCRMIFCLYSFSNRINVKLWQRLIVALNSDFNDTIKDGFSTNALQ